MQTEEAIHLTEISLIGFENSFTFASVHVLSMVGTIIAPCYFLPPRVLVFPV
jgi:hypothetical protein